jgi:hypothetical protein
MELALLTPAALLIDPVALPLEQGGHMSSPKPLANLGQAAGAA